MPAYDEGRGPWSVGWTLNQGGRHHGCPNISIWSPRPQIPEAFWKTCHRPPFEARPWKISEVKGYLPPVRTLHPVLLTLHLNTSAHQGCEMGLEPDNEPQRSLMIHPPANRFTTSSFTSRATPIAGHMFSPAVKGFLQAGVYLTGACGTPAVSLSAALIPHCFPGCPIEGHLEMRKSQCEQGGW